MNYNNSAALATSDEDVFKYSKRSYEIFNKSKTVSKNSTAFVNTINFLGGYYLTKGHYEKDDIKKKRPYCQKLLRSGHYVEVEMVKHISFHVYTTTQIY